MRRFALAAGYVVFLVLLSTVAVFAAMRALAGESRRTLFTPGLPAADGFLDYVGEYFAFMGGIVTLDWGQSWVHGGEISEMVWFHGRNSLILAATALFLVFAVGVPLGLLAAWRRGSLADASVQIGAALGLGFPHFWLALLLVWLFGPTLGWLPAGGCCSPQHLVLPAFVLAAEGIALTARMTRASVLDNLGSDFVTSLRSHGLAERRVMGVHVLRNSIIPIVSILGLRIGQIVGAAVVVETVFAWPGLGYVLVNAVRLRDYPVAQFFALVLVLTVVIGNRLADAGYSLANPRLRHR